jgi:alkaline phosphatase
MHIRLLYLFSLVFLNVSCSHSVIEPGLIENKPAVKNIILMIGDGMGLSQVSASYTATKGQMNISRAQYIGLSKTSSADHYITDSGAGGTALSTGKKTINESIGVDEKGIPQPTILEIAEKNGLSTGLIATSSITHATPASFIAHEISRTENCDIANDFIHSGIDIFIGGGKKFFEDPTKGNISEALRSEKYSIVYSLDSINPDDPNNIGCLAADDNLPKISNGRGNFLPRATNLALKKLSRNDKGFFIMIEGSLIDWGGHNNDIQYVLDETIDFDRAIGEAFRFADENPGTLVIVTADHETGGLSIVDGNPDTGEVIAHFSTTNHTSVMVPVYTYGAGAESFAGIYENTELFKKMINALNLDE